MTTPDKETQRLNDRIATLEGQINTIYTEAQNKINALKQEKKDLEDQKKLLEQEQKGQKDKNDANDKTVAETHQKLDNIEAKVLDIRNLFK